MKLLEGDRYDSLLTIMSFQVSIDTACSSALIAAHLGLKHAQSEGTSALAASINLILAETTTAAAFAAGMLTQNGRCKTLDSSADGYVRFVLPNCACHKICTVVFDTCLCTYLINF